MKLFLPATHWGGKLVRKIRSVIRNNLHFLSTSECCVNTHELTTPKDSKSLANETPAVYLLTIKMRKWTTY